jgi:hypothetical protein
VTLRAAAALALALGVGSAAGMAAWFAGLPGLAPWLLPVALAAGGLAAAGRSRGEVASASGRPERVLLATVAALACAAFALQSLRAPDGSWDAWMIWNLKARALGRAGPEVAFSAEIPITHPDYPPLVPGLVAQLHGLAGREFAGAAVAVAAVFGALAVALLSRAAGVVAATALLGTPFFWKSAASQCADVPLAVWLLVSVVAAGAARARGDRRLLAVSGLAAGLGAFTKNEGLLIALATAAAVGLTGRARLRDLGAWTLGALPALGLVAWFKLAWAPPNDLVALTTPRDVLARLTDGARLLDLAVALARVPVQLGKWNVFAAALPFALLLARRRPLDPTARIALVAAGLALGGYALVYALTPHAVRWHVMTSADRLLLHVWPALLLGTARALGGPIEGRLQIRGDGSGFGGQVPPKPGCDLRG